MPAGATRMPLKRLPTGLLLVRGEAEAVAGWALGGLTTVRVVPLTGGWTGIVPVTATSVAPPPYDDPIGVLLARPVPHRMRPCLGVAVVDGQALVASTSARWRAIQRWVVWRPSTGLVRPGGLPSARLADLVHLVGAGDPEAVGALADVLHDPAGDALSVLRDVLDVLGLPGADLLDDLELRSPPSSPTSSGPSSGTSSGPSSGTSGATSSRPGTHHVEPSASRAAAFIRMVSEDESWREETGGPP
ncbi:MAG: hypothetical protein ABI890_17815 [Lapillicoccus sp.]